MILQKIAFNVGFYNYHNSHFKSRVYIISVQMKTTNDNQPFKAIY